MKLPLLRYTATVFFCLLTAVSGGSAQTVSGDLTLEHVIGRLSLESPSAQIEKLYYLNDILEYENYKKGMLPAVSLSVNPLNLNRSLRLLQNPSDGSYSYVNDYSNSSSLGVSVNQKIGFTGGSLSVNSSLDYLNEFSMGRHSFGTTPFSIGYSQQLWGGGRLHRMERKIEEQKNLVMVKQYCTRICQIQNEALEMFLDAARGRLEMELAERNSHTNDTLLEISRLKLEHGSITEYDHKQIELQALNVRYTLEGATRNYEESRMRLCTYLGISPEGVSIVVPELDMPPLPDSELVMELVRLNNTYGAEKRIEEMEAERNLLSTRSSSKFNGNFSINYGMNQHANNLVDAYRNGNTRGAVSVGLQIPVFQWGTNRNDLRIAENSFQATMLGIEKQLREFEGEVREKISAYSHSVNLWLTAQQAWELAGEQYLMLVRKFRLEKVSIFELTTAQSEQNAAMERYFAAMRDVYTNYYSLRLLTLYDFAEGRELENVLLLDNRKKHRTE